jgi:hypothetical protein
MTLSDLIALADPDVLEMVRVGIGKSTLAALTISEVKRASTVDRLNLSDLSPLWGSRRTEPLKNSIRCASKTAQAVNLE